MSDLLPFIITGLVTGTVYGLAGSGLVLTYKTSGIFNFGHGALLTAASIVFYWINVKVGWDWKIAFAVSVFVLGPLLGLLLEAVSRNLSRQRMSMKIVGTVGLAVLVPALCVALFEESRNGARVDRFLPFSDRGRYKVRVFDANVFGDQILTAVIAVVCVAGLYVLFRFTRIGTAMRAAVDDPDLLDLAGTSPVEVRRIAWCIGSTFAALSGVLLLPNIGLQAYSLTFLAMYAFGAAALGGFGSIPIAFVGGLAIGVAQDVVGFVVNDQHWTTVAGLPDALPFVVLFVVLLVMPRRRLAPPVQAEARPPLQWQGPAELRLGVGALVAIGLVSVPWLVDTKLPFFTIGLCQATLMLSLGLLVRTSGQVSLCHGVFAAIGAVSFSQFHVGLGIPWLLALLLAGLVCVPVGAVVALPAIRLHGIYLALATFGFGILVQRLFFPQSWMFFTFAGSRRVPAPFGTGTARDKYFAVLIALVVVALVVVAVNQSRLGRLLRGMGGSQLAISTLGLSINVTKVIVFCLSAFLAGIAGVMFGVALTNIDGSTAYFQPFYSLVLVTLLALAPFREPWYAIFSGVMAVLPGYIDSARAPDVLNVLFGLFAIMVSLRGGHPSMHPTLRAFFERFRLPRRPRPIELAVSPPRTVEQSPGLAVANLSVRFGGLIAVDDVTFEAPLGRITGLIGPNGAGKTTTFNVCSGINRDAGGRVSLKGVDLTGRSASSRARQGLGRTFQRMELCDSLTVRDNVALGHEGPTAGARLAGQVVAVPAERIQTLQSTAAALELCGITHLADKQAGELSTGERRLVELARCLAGPFDLLLLDEPSSGLDHTETVVFGEVLRRVRDERGCGILLVEHDMSLVMRVCDFVYVLDFGRLLFEGTPAEIAASPAVRAAYLGSSADELEVVG